MAHIEATKSTEIQKLLDENGGVAVIDLYATWCGPCKHISPYVHKKNEETKIALAAVDVDKSDQLSKAYQVTAMPTFLVVQGKWDNVIERIIGGGQANVNKVYQVAIKKKN